MPEDLVFDTIALEEVLCPGLDGPAIDVDAASVGLPLEDDVEAVADLIGL